MAWAKQHGIPVGPGRGSGAGSLVAYVLDTRHVGVVSTTGEGSWPVRLSTGADFALDPTWSPDGRWLALDARFSRA